MFYTPPSLFDPPTYPRKKLPLAGSAPEQAQSQSQPQPTAKVPYRPTEQASPRPRILSPLPDPSQRRPIAAPAAPPSVDPAPQIPSQPPTQTAPSLPPQPRPTAAPASQSQPVPAPSTPQPVKQPGPQVLAQQSAQSQQLTAPPPATPTPDPQRQSNTISQNILPLPATNVHAATDQPTAQTQAGAESSQAGQQAHESKPDAPSQQAADAAAAARLESSLSTTPGYAQAIPALKALDQEAKSRLAELHTRHPQGPPPEAVQALHADLAQRSSTILAQSQQKLAAAQSAYAGLKAAMNTQAENAVRPTIAKNLAEALRIPTEEADSLIEDMRNLDWNEHIAQDHKPKTPEDYAREREKIQESKSISGFIHALGAGAKELWNGTQDKRQTRTLTNGAIIVNPAITGEKEYQDAIAASTASPEAKAAALQRYPEIRQAAGQNVLDNIQEIADTFGKEHIQDWKDFASQRPQDVPEQEWAMRFAEKLKTDADASPFATKLKEITRSLAQGTNEAGQQAAGFIGGLTGSQSAMDLAAKLTRRSHAYGITKQLDATESHGMLSRAVFSQLPRLLPSLIPASRAAKLIQGGTRVFAATKIGQRLLPALGATIQGAATPAQAVKAIETLTRAALAGSAAMGGAQTYGSQISDIYNTLRSEHPELSHEQALHAAQAPAIVSGLATAALTTLGGSHGVQRLLTRPAEARAAITQVFTSRMQQLGHLGGDFTKGALKENIEETADGLISAIAKAVGTGHSVQQAVGDYIKQIPENAIVTSLVGGGGEAIPAAGDSTVRRPPGQTAATPPALPPAPQQHSTAAVAAPASQHPIPDATTPNTTGSDQPQPSTASNSQPPQTSPSGSGQQQSTTVNNGQPSSTPPSALPVPTFEEAGTAKQTIDKLKAHNSPLSADQQQTLDAAEKTFARRTEHNILKQQAGIEKRGGKLHATTAKALEAARATLARPRPEGNTDIVGTPDKTTSSAASSSGSLPPGHTATTQGVTPPAATSSVEVSPPAETSSAPARTPGNTSQNPDTGSQPSPATSSTVPSKPSIPPSTTKSDPGSGQPSQKPPSRVPTFEEAIAARNTADKLKAQKAPLSPDQQQTLDAAEKTFARRTEQNILNQQAGIEKRGGKLHPTTAKALAAAQAILARPGPGGVLEGSSNADNFSPYHEGTSSQKPATTNQQTADRPAPNATANTDARPTLRPSTPPLNVPQSQRLINNVANMRPEARQHPQVQADMAQAQNLLAAAQAQQNGGDVNAGKSLKEEQSSMTSIAPNKGIDPETRFKEPIKSKPETEAALYVTGAGTYPTVPWDLNPEGTPERTIVQAEMIAKEHGVHIPPWVSFKPKPANFYGEGTWAKYCSFGPPLTHVSWKHFLERDGTLTIGIDERLLQSDEGIVGIFAHEMHEVNALYEILQYGDSISLERLGGLVNDPHGLLHQQAWDISDKKITQMRKSKYDARGRKF